MTTPKRHLLLTGVPEPRGFFTEEVRERGERRGFRLVRFDGASALIAHVELPKTHRVSKYGVDVAAIDRASDEAFKRRGGNAVYLIDEVGKMECLSERVVHGMRRLLDSSSTVVASVACRGGGFIAEAKAREDCELWTLTRANRDAMPQRMLEWLSARRGR